MPTVPDGRPGAAGRVLNPAEPNPLLRYEYDRGSNYELDTRLTTALSALVPEAELHHADHRFFQVLHLITEYAWVAVHHSLCDLARALRERNLVLAARHTDRCTGLAALPVTVMRQLIDSLPQLSLLSMRAMFPPNTTGLDSPGARNLRRAALAVWAEFEAVLDGAGVGLDTLVEAAEPGFRHDQGTATLADLMAGLYRFDARVLEWKQVHLHMVWMLLGGQPEVLADAEPGDAAGGAALDRPVSLRGRPITDLERMAARPMFPRLWQQSTAVFQRAVAAGSPVQTIQPASRTVRRP
jgi:tryptophan 2,3-dioxygenase